MIDPMPPVAGDPVTISYDPSGGPLAGASQVFLHYGFNDWDTVHPTDLPMNWDAAQSKWATAIPVSNSANQLDLVFNNGGGLWDNNNGQDWHFSVEGAAGPTFVMDGVLDASAQLVASHGGRNLYAVLEGDILYVATEDAGEGSDVFLYLAETPGVLTPANWAKNGQVAAWDAFLADENDNGFAGWFDAQGSTQVAAGTGSGVLEGTINLAEEFGSLPTEIYLAVGLFGSPDGAALVSGQQVPASLDANGNIEASEYYLLQLISPATGDFDGDGDVDGHDFLVWQRNPSVGNLADWLIEYGNASMTSASAVPEPGFAFPVICLLLSLLSAARPLAVT